ncbi:serine protease snake-like [Photinus pyralis]|nr:serine protease snake-like [Photinus pyralis]
MNGTCVLLSSCDHARNALKIGYRPQICGFQGMDPIVCCIERTYSSGTAKQDVAQSGVKSRQKCVEYQQYVYENVSNPLIGEGVVRVDRCGWNVGRLLITSRIQPEEYPHIALIGYEGKSDETLWLCTGSLISEEFVLIAAHCAYTPVWGVPKRVRIGNHQISTSEHSSEVQDFTVKEILNHPEFKHPAYYNDIALIRLNRKVRLDAYSRPACLHTTFDIPVRRASALGWDHSESFENSNKHLRKTSLDFVTNLNCNDSTYISKKRLRKGIVTDSQVCAGSHGNSKDVCEIVTDGPLQIIDPNIYCMYSIVGIKSFGRACGEILEIHTRVSNYIEWIEQNVWP